MLALGLASVAALAGLAHARVHHTTAKVRPRSSSGVDGLMGSRAGSATTYGGNWSGGACLFSDYDQGSFAGVAIGGASDWYGSASCGACLSVTGATGSATVMVVDKCPECEAGHLDLFQDIAAQVDVNYSSKGVFDITWEQVDCPVFGNMQFKNKEGTSAYYFAMQVRNIVEPVDTLEVSTDGGASWTSVHREDFNYFVNYSGFGASPIDVRVTSMTGKQVVQSGITVSDGTVIQGSSQF
ncbi:Non-catalytic module family EXPN protein [Schizophyllum amplum]|uniref:Non-catalytic module family EXPN protein n=1 Tax=Schizophyllum amplum TaxID=97359 RepID=A0A550CI86_9AGAR|nr:Non-catalytic module family EXPN protein [Auriculariopsis ampla]